MQMQMGGQDDGQNPGQDDGQNGAQGLQEANPDGQNPGQTGSDDEGDEPDDGAFTGRFHDDDPHDFERYSAPKAKLQKAVTGAPHERIIRIVRM